MREPATVLLEDALIVTIDDSDTIGTGSVAVRDGRIAALGDAGELRRAFPTAERIGCANRILMPGLVNAHLHPEAHVMKGIVEELDLHAWGGANRFEAALAFLGKEENRQLQRAAVRASLADSLLSGTTCVATYGVTVGADAAAIGTLGAFGMRGHVTIRDLAFAPAVAADGSTVIPADRLDPPRMYRLHAEEALTVGELQAAAAAHARGERIVMHAAETRHRLDLVRATFGVSTVRLLAQYGLLSDRVLLSHAVHVDDEERELLARAHACVIASPAAEMKLADGIAPIVDYLKVGVTIALGTDSAVCNNGNDMLLECRQLGLAQKLAYGADVLPADRILRCATAGGARALGGEGTYGAIVPGLSADLTLVDTSSPRLQPLVHRDTFTNVTANLVYAATAQDVTDVMVRGRWCVRDRRLAVADQDRLWEELALAAASLHDSID